MLTVHSTMSLFSKPGPALRLVEERGWKGIGLIPPEPGWEKQDSPERQQILMDRAEEIEYLIIDTTPVTRAFLDKAKRLKLVSMFGIGMDHIDVAAATERGVVVTRAMGGNSRSVAELALGFIFCLARHIPRMHVEMHAGMWRSRRGVEIEGKTLGIVGLGGIGASLAGMGGALGMNLLASVRSPKPELAAGLGCTVLPLDELLPRVDYLCLCVPGGAGKPLIGARELALMKPTACVVNIGRGSVLDLDALTAALADGKLGGAALDVYPEEPIDPAHPVLALPNVVTSPHAGSSTTEAVDRVFAMCLEEVALRSGGKESPRAFNPEAYRRVRG